MKQLDGTPLVDPFELIKRARELHKTGGLKRGSSTGFPSLDRHYTVATKQWTAVTGTPGSGKSEFVDALCGNLYETGEWAFAIYSPENYPVETHLVKWVEKMVRKPFNEGPTKRMTLAEFDMAAAKICEHVMWLDPELKTPDELIETALHYQPTDRKLGIVLDPWNTLDHERKGMSETDYVSSVLTRVTRLCRSANAHIWLVAHPAKMDRAKSTGERPKLPTPYDISGSAHWYNKADNIITVHRDQSDDATQDVEIHVQKVRFKHIGRVGAVTLKYDRVTGRYFEIPGGGFTVGREQYADPQSPRSPA